MYFYLPHGHCSTSAMPHRHQMSSIEQRSHDNVKLWTTSPGQLTSSQSSLNTFIQQFSNKNCIIFFLYGPRRYMRTGMYSLGSIPVFSSVDTGFSVPFMLDMNAQRARQFSQFESTMYSRVISFVEGFNIFVGISLAQPLKLASIVPWMSCGMLNLVKCKFKFLYLLPKTSSRGQYANHLFQFAQLTSMLNVYATCQLSMSCQLCSSNNDDRNSAVFGSIIDCPSAIQIVFTLI